MRKLLCILALATTLHAQANPDFVALDKERHQLLAHDKDCKPDATSQEQEAEDEISKLRAIAPPNAKWESIPVLSVRLYGFCLKESGSVFSLQRRSTGETVLVKRIITFLLLLIPILAFGQAVFCTIQ